MRRPKLKSGCCGAIGVFKCKKALAKLASAAYSLGMFSRTIRAFLFASLVALEIGGGLCPAQEDPRQLPFAPAIRYHFGDDADGKQGWAASQFDDSAWMVAQYGRWAVPAFSSDGFLWVRARVPVQAGLNEPLALRITGDSYHMLTNEVFVNGVKLADSGRLSTRSDALFDLPPALITVPSIAIVVLRIQYDPYIRKNVRVTGMRFSINESRVLRLEQRAHRARILVGQAPYLTVYLIIVLLGIGLLGFWKRSGGGEILLCSLWLISGSAFVLCTVLLDSDLLPLPWPASQIPLLAMQPIAFIINVEFLWVIHRLRFKALKRLLYVLIVMYSISLPIALLSTRPTDLSFCAQQFTTAFGYVVNALNLGLNFWVLLVMKRNRLIAVTLIADALAPILANLGLIPYVISIAGFRVLTFSLADLASSIALFVMVGGRARQAWRARDKLRIRATHSISK